MPLSALPQSLPQIPGASRPPALPGRGSSEDVDAVSSVPTLSSDGLSQMMSGSGGSLPPGWWRRPPPGGGGGGPGGDEALAQTHWGHLHLRLLPEALQVAAHARRKNSET